MKTNLLDYHRAGKTRAGRESQRQITIKHSRVTLLIPACSWVPAERFFRWKLRGSIPTPCRPAVSFFRIYSRETLQLVQLEKCTDGAWHLWLQWKSRNNPNARQSETGWISGDYSNDDMLYILHNRLNKLRGGPQIWMDLVDVWLSEKVGSDTLRRWQPFY